MARFAFRFDTLHRWLAAPFGVTPQTTMVEIDEERLRVRFGPWVVETPVANVVGVEPTGPFAASKTVGPARLSLADRGLTMATSSEAGLCLRLDTPVRGIDPFGWVRHPGLTVTVDRVDDLRRALEGPLEDRDLGGMSAAVTGESPWAMLGRRLRWPAGMAVAVARHIGEAGNVRWSFEDREGPPPPLNPPAERADLQEIQAGVGPTYERRYRVAIAGTRLTPEELLDRVASNLNAVSPVEVAEFVNRTEPTLGAEEYVVRMPGPWDAPVRCVERTPTSFRFATLHGHMEAGQIEFRAARTPEHESGDGRIGPLVFEIRSVARSNSRTFSLVYDKLRVAARMQMHMWVHLCRRVARLAGGRADGPVEVTTIRYEG